MAFVFSGRTGMGSLAPPMGVLRDQDTPSVARPDDASTSRTRSRWQRLFGGTEKRTKKQEEEEEEESSVGAHGERRLPASALSGDAGMSHTDVAVDALSGDKSWRRMASRVGVMHAERVAFHEWRLCVVAARLRMREAEVMRYRRSVRVAADAFNGWQSLAENRMREQHLHILAAAMNSIRLKQAALESWRRGAARRTSKRLRRYEAVSLWARRVCGAAWCAWREMCVARSSRREIADAMHAVAMKVLMRSSMTTWRMVAELFRAKDEVAIRDHKAKRYLDAWRRENYRRLQLAYYVHVAQLCHQKLASRNTFRRWRAKLDATQREREGLARRKLEARRCTSCLRAWLMLSRWSFRVRIIEHAFHATKSLALLTRCLRAWRDRLAERRRTRAAMDVASEADRFRVCLLGMRAWRRYLSALRRERVYNAFADGHAKKGLVKRTLRGMRRIVARANLEEHARKRGARVLLRRTMGKWKALLAAARQHRYHLMLRHFLACRRLVDIATASSAAADKMRASRTMGTKSQCFQWWRTSFVPSRRRAHELASLAASKRRATLMAKAIHGFAERVRLAKKKALKVAAALRFRRATAERRTFATWTTFVDACRRRHEENRARVHDALVRRSNKMKAAAIARWRAAAERAALIAEQVRESLELRSRELCDVAVREWRMRVQTGHVKRLKVRAAVVHRNAMLQRRAFACLAGNRAREIEYRLGMAEAMGMFRARMQRHVALVWLEVAQCRRQAKVDEAAARAASDVVCSLHKAAPYARRWRVAARTRREVREQHMIAAASLSMREECESDCMKLDREAVGGAATESGRPPVREQKRMKPDFVIGTASERIAREMERIGEEFRTACAVPDRNNRGIAKVSPFKRPAEAMEASVPSADVPHECAVDCRRVDVGVPGGGRRQVILDQLRNLEESLHSYAKLQAAVSSTRACLRLGGASSGETAGRRTAGGPQSEIPIALEGRLRSLQLEARRAAASLKLVASRPLPA